MRHCREDYNAIQPWPTKRPHFFKDAVGKTHNADGDPTFNEEFPDACNPIIPDDEPVFILRAQDRFASTLVREWAAMLERVARKELLDDEAPMGQGGTPEYDAAFALVEQVRRFAIEMDAYADEHGRKTPDTPREFVQ